MVEKDWLQYLVEVDKLDVMAEDDIQVVKVEASEALAHAPRHPLSAEIEVVVAISSTLGRDDVALTRDGHRLQGLPQQRLRPCGTIIPDIQNP